MSDEERPGQRLGPEEWKGLGRGGFEDIDYIDDGDCATICGDNVVDVDDACSSSDGGAAARVRHFKSNV